MTTQDSPTQDGHDDATDRDRLAGLVAQVRADYLLGTTSDAAGMLRTRLSDAGVTVSDEDFDKLVATVEQ